MKQVTRHFCTFSTSC